MRILPTRIHGLLDYLVGLLLIAAPWVFGMPDGIASYVPFSLGLLTIGYSLLTDYEWGLAPVLGMPVHLMIDLLNGLLLAASPWIFGFSELMWKPHLFIGLTELLVVAISSPVSSRKRSAASAHLSS